jgi:hypothetical protein
MGWLFGNYSRKEAIEDLTGETSWTHTDTGARVRRTCLGKTYKGCAWAGVLYAALKVEYEEDGKWVEKDRYILVAMIRCQKNLPMPWGYKDMDESMHPYYYGCPLKYFDLVPEVSCQDWRDQTRARWKEIAEKTARTKAARKARRMN